MKKISVLIIFLLISTNSFVEKQPNTNDITNFLEQIN